MKKLFVLIFASFLFYATAQGLPAIRYSGGANWYPIFPIGADKLMLKNSGVGIELMNEIAKRLGTKVELVPDVPWARLWSMLDDGTLDIMVGAGATAERQTKYVETESFMESDYRLFVKVGMDFAFTKLEDLRGKSLAMALGAKFGDEFDLFIADPKNNIKIDNVPGGKTNSFPMLNAGRVDMVPMDVFDGTYGAKTLGLDGKIIALPKSIGKSPIYAYISKKSPWASKVNEISAIIKAMKKDGTLEKILKKY